MRLKELFIWITLTALLQSSGAQEVDNNPANVSDEEVNLATSEMTVIEKETDEDFHHPTTEVVDEMTQPALPPKEDEPAEVETETPEIHIPVQTFPLNTMAPEKDVDNDPESIDYQNEEPQQEVTVPQPTNPPTTLRIPTLPPMPKIPPAQPPNYCFSCTSPLNGTCLRNPTKRLQCPLKPGNRNGCFTLVNRDTKLIMRGCLTELSEEGNNYCLKENKYCQLCYEMACNEKDAVDATGGAGLIIWPCSLLAVSFSLISYLI